MPTPRRKDKEIVSGLDRAAAGRIMTTHRIAGPLISLFLVVGVATLGAACRSREPESPNLGLTSAVDPPRAADLGRGAPRFEEQGTYNMYVAPPVREVCSGSPPFFEFDSSETRTNDQPTMETLASCMLTGPLRGKTIKLVGRTDPRGTEAYNHRLGLERADRVKQYLVNHGVEPSRVLVESAGEDQASSAPEGWATDRRVEVQLVR